MSFGRNVPTIRGRLTAWYSTALALTLAAFAAVLYFARRSASYQDLDQRIRSEAELTAGLLVESFRARAVLVQTDTAHRLVLVPAVAELLEVVPDYLIVTAQDGSLLFASADARALTFQNVEQLRQLVAFPPPPTGPTAGAVRLASDGPNLRYAVRYLREIGPPFGAILAGADVRTAELAPQQLLESAALILPIGLVAALLVG